MTDPIPMPWLQRELRFNETMRGGRPFAAYVLGLAFGFGWTPRIRPILGAILTVSAVSATASMGIVLLGVYSLGLGVPFLGAALFTDALLRRRRALGRAGRLLRVGGLIKLTMVLGVLFLVSGAFKFFVGWGIQRSELKVAVILSGLASLLIGFIILSNFPASAATSLGILLGIELISNGVSAIALGWSRTSGGAVLT